MTYKIDCVELKTNEFNEQYGKFIFESLERGQSITLGNSLRRILLADLTGVAIVALRIAGINNEFSSIPGVLEDVLEIILNIKEIIIELEDDYISDIGTNYEEVPYGYRIKIDKNNAVICIYEK